MKTIENHFKGKTIHFVGKVIVYGCESFKIEQLEDMCLKYGLSNEHIEIGVKTYNENQLVEEDWDILIKNENYRVRVAAAMQKHGLYTLIKDKDYNVRVDKVMRKYGLELLIKDENGIVHGAVGDYLEINKNL